MALSYRDEDCCWWELLPEQDVSAARPLTYLEGWAKTIEERRAANENDDDDD